MTPESTTIFRNEQNQSENDTEYIARLLFELREAGKTDTELAVRDMGDRSKEHGEIRSDHFRASKERQELIETAERIVQAVILKDIDLSGVTNGLIELKNELSLLRAETIDGRADGAEREDGRTEKHEVLLATIGDLIEATKENKPEKPDFGAVTETTKEGDKKTQELLSAILAEISLLDKEQPEIKIPEFPKEIVVKKPSWYEPFKWEGLDWNPMKKLLEPMEKWLEKIYKKEPQEIPVKDGRVLVSVDRTGGGGTGVTDTTGAPINPATEEKQDDIIIKQNPKQTLYDKTSGSLDYKGVNLSPTAATSATDWQVTKYVRSSGSLVQKIVKEGSWDNRVSLF